MNTLRKERKKVLYTDYDSLVSNFCIIINSTSSLCRHSMIRETVQELQSQQMREQENRSLDQQAWFAGELDVKTASDRLDRLPVGM